MQLLHEEIFRMIFKFINEIHIFPIRILTKIIFYLVVLGIIGFIIWLILTGKYIWALVVVGLIILGEVAHFIRKSREKEMNERIEIKNDLEEEAKNPLNKEGLVIKKPKKEEKKKIIIKNEPTLKKQEKVLNKDGLLSK